MLVNAALPRHGPGRAARRGSLKSLLRSRLHWGGRRGTRPKLHFGEVQVGPQLVNCGCFYDYALTPGSGTHGEKEAAPAAPHDQPIRRSRLRVFGFLSLYRVVPEYGGLRRGRNRDHTCTLRNASRESQQCCVMLRLTRSFLLSSGCGPGLCVHVGNGLSGDGQGGFDVLNEGYILGVREAFPTDWRFPWKPSSSPPPGSCSS